MSEWKRCPRCTSDTCPGRDANGEGCTTTSAEDFVTAPVVVVPHGFIGSAPEAIALAVAGAVQAIADDGNLAQANLEETVGRLSALVAAYPRTSFAASESAYDDAVAWLRHLSPEPEPPT